MPPITVYYDGGCPVCSREISYYRARPGADRFTWIDVSRPDADLGNNLTRDQAMARMHIRLANGRLLSGAAAFAEMWRRMPNLAWLGWLLAMPPFETLAEGGYRLFLLTRKLWR
jgi:predicted DCC family thiol-disulfide oxidoreductase YuxK